MLFKIINTNIPARFSTLVKRVICHENSINCLPRLLFPGAYRAVGGLGVCAPPRQTPLSLTALSVQSFCQRKRDLSVS